MFDNPMHMTAFIDFRKSKTIGSLIYKLAARCWILSDIHLPSLLDTALYRNAKKPEDKRKALEFLIKVYEQTRADLVAGRVQVFKELHKKNLIK